VIIGSVFMLVAYPPVPAWDRYASTHPYFRGSLIMAVKATMGMVSLIVAFACAYALARRYEIDGLSAGVISVVSFLLAGLKFTVAKGAFAIEPLPVAWFGAQGMFVAIILAIYAAEVSRFFVKRNWVFRLPESVPEAVVKSFMSLAPAFATITTVWVLVHVLHVDLFNLIALAVSPFLTAVDSLPGALVIVLVDSVIWLFGVHPVALMAPVIAAWTSSPTARP